MNLQKPSIFAITLLVYQSTILAILYIFNISPLCSVHIMLFLKVYIPLLLLGFFATIRVMATTKKNINEGVMFLYGLSATLIGACIYHVFAVLLGAAFTEGLEETFSFSCLCATLTIFPLFIVHETQWEEFVNYLPDSLDPKISLHDAIKTTSFFTVAGAWVGAFPIPLDWDRDWQTWPITCCFGAISGNLIGLFYVIIVSSNYFERIMFWKRKVT
ncbi:uncharacterized protein LOC130656283 [Hydractinia symbiolongicarpus]|uniref:uncharacterized protein LOC130656283 n=1 Tax=Hydractinia symbiolongicarpus TaxID=13093 RepID=UPI00254E42B4|nr:uncharacterized protein LOC130656283 [Hydractinia symbiolongicarpus]